MGKNPINLALRFFLELAGLFAFGYYGWTQFNGILRFLLALALPFIAAAIWGIFRVPGDGGAPIVRVAGVLRLLIEVIYFASATWCLFAAGAVTAGWIFGCLTLFHYLISYDRLAWLIKQ